MCEQRANSFMDRMFYHARAIEFKLDGMWNTRIQQYICEKIPNIAMFETALILNLVFHLGTKTLEPLNSCRQF